ncbi:MAG TPA: non-ribosomal peptide synthase/polyketide synthase [Pyrinomonadaceae bacterium]|nr:non-ribosomal peptide synthase/polyketide synthase [Pyrinomonadaceae bacterium]
MSQTDQTLVELLRRRAGADPSKTAYTYLADGEAEAGGLSYGELDRRARAVAVRLAEAGAAGERVLLLYPSGLEFVSAFFGCLYAGAVAVPAYPPRAGRHLARVQTIVRDARAKFALTTAAIRRRLDAFAREQPEAEALHWITTDTLDAGELAGLWREPPLTGSTLAFLQYTSGSTSAPRGVMVSHGNLLHNERLIQAAFRQTEESVIVGWLPLYHDMGLIGNVLQPLYLGASCVLMSPAAFLQRPARWLRAISHYRATTSGAPNFAYDLCVRKVAPGERERLDLGSWRVAYNGAEPVRLDTLERFAAAFADCGFRREAFFPCYGLAEATLFVAGKAGEGDFVAAEFDAEGLQQNLAAGARPGAPARSLVSCGAAPEGQRVVIADPVTRERRDRSAVGEIWVAGPSVAQGYWGRPEATEEAFGARLAGSNEGPFLRTGDLGFVRDGELFVTGRLKDLIIVRGRNYYPQDLEWTAERSHPAVVAGGVAAFSLEDEGAERLAVAAEVDSAERAAEIFRAVQESIALDHEIQVHAVALLRPRTIPKTSSGKIQRRACRTAFLEGGLQVLAEWRAPERAVDGAAPAAEPVWFHDAATLTEEQLAGWLAAELAAQTGYDVARIELGRSCAAAGLDSLGAVELAHRVERELGVVFAPTDFLEETSIAELAAALGARLKGAGGQGAEAAETTPPAFETETREAVTREAETPEAGAPAPLSRGQQALWFLQQLQPESTAYHISSALRITTELDAAALRRAFERMAERHPALRTTFAAADDAGPVQRVREEPELSFVEHDARGWTEDELNDSLVREANEPFDLERGPLFRLRLFARGRRDHVLLLTIHHIVSDFWSLGVLLRELGELYEAERGARGASLPPAPTTQYADYVRWQAGLLAGEAGERLWRYWREQLSGAQLVLDLPFDKPRQPNQSFCGASLPARLRPELAARLKALGDSQHATLFMTLLAGFYALLYRYTGQSDLLVGSPAAGRTRAGFSGVVGYFVNPLVLRAQIAGGMTFKELLAQVRETTLAGLRHQDFPFPTLVERLQPERNPSYSPLFQVMFVLQKAHPLNEDGLAAFALGEAEARLRLGALELESVALKQRVAQFDLTLMMTETEGGLGLSLQYCTDLFEEATIRRMAGHFRRLLEEAAADPERRVAELTLLTAAEERQLLVEWNATRSDYPRGQAIHRLVEEQARRTPGAVALVCGPRSLTYSELNGRANRLARRLRGLGVGRESRVGVLLGRSPELVVSLLAVLKAGGAYVPLDPQYPQDRLSFMLEDGGAGVLVTSEGLRGRAGEGYAGAVLCVEGWEANETGGGEAEDLSEAVESEQLAYVIYTSGSTGRPKGVAITHRSACVFLHWARESFGPEELAGVLAATSVCFDLSVFELFATLSWGGTVLLAENVLSIAESPLAGRVTLINTVPSAMTELARLGQVPPSVRTINLAGEALKRSLTERLYELPQVERVVNLYGPSEDTTYSTFAEVRRGGTREPEIGRPVADTRTYILDGRGQIVPVGVAGELFIGGDGLARGYLNRPSLTAERFLPDPFSGEPGARLYRTGDLTRYLPDGQIEYLGRLDHQVKVRGFRIELGEIEAALEAHAAVRQAVVVARVETGGEQRLVGYYVAEGEPAPEPRELRDHLKESLPEYMIPSSLVRLEEVPLTPNGKVDRKALPAPQAEEVRGRAAHLSGQASVEEILTGIWMEVLGAERVGPEENFFDLGGHSLLATQVVARARAAFQIQLPVNSLFEAPTVAGLTARVAELVSAGQGLPAPARVEVEGDSYRLSFAQQRLWFLDQLEPGSSTYNMPGGALLAGRLDVPTLESALAEMVRRHDVFRTTFHSVGGEPAQFIAGRFDLELPVTDLGDLPAAEQQLRAKQLGAEESRHVFDLARGPLVRFRLLRLSDTRHVLLVTMHHIISDGWSLGILIRETVTLYEAFLRGEPSPLPPLPIQYVDYARQQREEFSRNLLGPQLDYWRRELAGAPPLLELPLDRPRPPQQTYRGAAVAFELPEWLSGQLAALSRREGVTLFMTLLAGFQILLSRYSGQDDILVGTPIAGRRQRETEDLIGFFVNTLVMRLDLSGDPTAREALRQVRARALDAYANQDVPFEMLVEELRPVRSMSHSPLFQVMMVMQNTPLKEAKFSELELELLEGAHETAKFDLTLELSERAGGLAGSLEYNVDLFDEATARRMLAHYEHLLGLMVADLSQPVRELALLTPEEARQLLLSWNRDHRRYEHAGAIHRLVEARAAETPEAAALTLGARSLTYRELNARANRLARRLRRDGVGPDVCVCVLAEPSLEMIVGLLGVLKAGGAYVPLDPHLPPERISLMLADVGAPLVLTQQGLASRLPAGAARVFLLDADWQSIADESPADPRTEVGPENLAYCIYTSGSTGTPKGVMVTHGNVTRLLAATEEWFGFGGQDVWTMFHSYAFDFSVWEIWGALAHGGRLVVVPYLTARAPDEFHELLRRERVTVLNQTPSAFRQLVAADALRHGDGERGGPERLALRYVVFGGEALDIRGLEPWFARHGDERPRLVNMYGITETTVHVTYRPLTAADVEGVSGSVIGRPIRDLQFYILDEQMRPVPPGVAGEIYVGGAGLARGYLNRPALTAERFVPHPYGEEAGARLYRTGDMARMQRGGEVEYLGRCDQQVKIRGFRIELGEIEAALAKCPGVAQAVVLVREDVPGDKTLAAYLLGDGAGRPAIEEVRRHAKEYLPEYMVPPAFVVLDAFPLNANGKVDRKALPAPEGRPDGGARDYVAPRTEDEELLAGIWSEVLGVERVGVNDDFFDLGGHSLLATQVATRAQEVFKAEIPLRRLFESPTIAGFAQAVEAARAARRRTLYESISRVSREGPLPLSYAQQRLWFLDQLAPGSPVYNIPTTARLPGALDPATLERAFAEVLRRHEALRTSFEGVGGQPVQRVHDEFDFALALTDLSALPAEEAAREAGRLAEEEAALPFDLTRAPLVRARLLRLGEREHVLLLTLHHIVGDGWSLDLLVSEVSQLYAALAEGRPSPLAELPIQYADYAAWQREWLTGEVLEGQLAYWRERLTGLGPLELPTDRPRPARQSFRGAAAARALDPELGAALKELSRRQGATLFMTLLAGWQALLSRYTAQTDIAVGTPVAGRLRPELEGLIGLFINTLVVRTDLSADPSFPELVGRVRDACLGAFSHQETPFEMVVEAVNPERSLSHTPLFQVMFTAVTGSPEGVGDSRHRLEGLETANGMARFDLSLAVVETDGGLTARLQYAADLFDEATAERLLAHYAALLASAVADPSRPVSELELLSGAERHSLLVGWNDTAASYPAGATLHGLFEAQAARTPGAAALVAEGVQLSYRELDERADCLARRLRRLGVGPDSLVGVLAERSAEMVVGLLGVLKAGGAYLPLDPDYPADRLAYMLEDAAAGVLLAQERLLARLPQHGARVVCLDSEWDEIEREDSSAPAPDVPSDALAYCIYTSGSTGRPKGVGVPHRAVVNRLLWSQAAYPLGAGDRVLQLASFGFDFSVYELFGPLVAGAAVVLPRHGGQHDTAYLVETIAAQGVTAVHFVPAMLQVFLGERGLERCRGLRLVFSGGEALPAELQDQFFEHFDADLYNQYGPTETTIDVTAWRCVRGDAGRRVPIGRPVSNTQVYLLDRRQRPVPVGVPGELYVGGDNLARGYLRRPALTAGRFIPDPFSGEPGARLYRTGDVARWTNRGALEYVGRADQQVKVRGFRIELAEVEAALLRHEAVAEAVVVARGEGAEKSLAAYVVFAVGAAAAAAELRERLRRELPEYMIPSAFVTLDALPLTPNGKVDRKALPAPEQAASESAWDGPVTPTEEIIAGIWGELLGVSRFGAEEDFFELGGHSLLATQMAWRVKATFGLEFGLREVFERATVRRLARFIDARLRGGADAGAEGEVAAGPRRDAGRERWPLSYAQQRLWFLDQLEPGLPAYHIPLAVRLRGELDLPALELTFGEIVRRHEALRTTFHVSGGEPVQVVSPGGQVGLPVTDLSGLPPEEGEAAALRLIEAEALRPFDLASGPLVRVAVVRLSAEDHLVLVTMHHIVSDGWSLGVMMREVAALYQAFAQGLPSPLPELPVQYTDYAVWQREYLSGERLEKQLAYWRGRLGGELPQTHLLPDRPRPPRNRHLGAYLSFTLPPDEVEPLQRFGARAGATLFMTLLTGFQLLLARYADQDDVIVGTPIANRQRPELEDLVGFFVNSLALRTRFEGDTSFEQALGRVREVTLGAYAHQDVPFEMLVEELQPERDLSRNPLFQVMFALNNVPRPEFRMPGLSLSWQEFTRSTARFDLEVQLTQQDGAVVGSLCYNTELYDEATARRLVGHFRRLLAEAVSDPRQSVRTLPLLSAEERRQLLFEWNETRRPYPAGAAVHEVFASRAAESPRAPALEFGERRLTYEELDRRADRLAGRLRRLGVADEARVGLLMERSAEMIVAMLGVLKAGGAYVPLDTSYPADRLAFMVEDAGISVLITTQALAAGLFEPLKAARPSVAATRLLSLDREWDEPDSPTAPEPLPAGAGGESLACVIYTSGSTGQPKGIGITHRGIARTVCDPGYIELGGADRVAHASNVSFDAATFEIWGALLNGSRLVGIEREVVLSPRAYAEELKRRGITALILTTALFNQIAAEEPQCFADVSHVLFGGEAADARRVREVLRAGGPRRLLNMYGPAESTTFTSWEQVEELSDDAAGVPIGKPVGNTRVYVVDRRMQPVPVGACGELLIGGAGLARGYLGRPALTAERFVPDPFSGEPGARLYRTGDVVRWTNRGALEFVGRRDNQIKLRGFRIELQEIEAALSAHAQVRQAAVVAERTETGAVRRLVGYVAAGEGVGGATLREYLRGRLPEYMIPSAFVTLDALPLTPNGKVDRKALPAPEQAASESAWAEEGPLTPTEEIVAGIFAGLLGAERVGAGEDFFELGGHSLLATELAWQVERAFGVKPALREVFEGATVRRLARLIDARLRGGAEGAADAGADAGAGGEVDAGPRRLAGRERWPLSFAQQRLWFLDRLHPGSPLYNIPAAVRLRGKLDLEVLGRCLDEIVRRHDAVRTVFVEADGEPAQVVTEPAAPALTFVDLSGMAEDERTARASELAAQEAFRPFDLGRGPLMRATLLRLGEEDHAALFTMHHIISDGWSVNILVGELVTLYEAFSEGRESPLPPLPVQYTDYAVWQRDWLRGEVLQRELKYWREQLGGLPTVLALPTDRPRPATQRFRGAARYVGLTREQAEALGALSRAEQATLFITLLAAFKALLYRYAALTDIPVGTPIAGRNHHQLENLIGFFVNTLVLRTRFDGGTSFRGLLREVREVALGAYAHQDVPFEMLVEELHPRRSMSYTPLFQVMFAFQAAATRTYSLPSGLRVGPLTGEGESEGEGAGEGAGEGNGAGEGRGRVKFDLTLALGEGPHGLSGSLSYDADLYDAVTIERMAANFQSLVDGLLADPDARLAELPLLRRAELEQLLTEATAPAASPARQTVAALFAAAAERTPSAPAVVSDGQHLSYQELDARSNQLAHHLRALGLVPEEAVALLLDPSPELIVALLAVVKAGGAFVPLPARSPAERVRQSMADAGARVLLTRQGLAPEGEPGGASVVLVDAQWQQVALHSDRPLTERAGAQQVAAVLRASAPDGAALGVMLTHEALSGEALALGARYELGAGDRFVGAFGFGHDGAVAEIFACLLRGAAVVAGPSATPVTPRDLLLLCRRERVSVLALPVASWEQLAVALSADAPPASFPETLRLLVVRGHKSFRKHLALWGQFCRRRNGSGPTLRVLHKYEPAGAATAVASWEAGAPGADSARQFQSSRPTIPLGHTLPHARVYVLDRSLSPAAPGVVGEVYVGGPAVARGYLRRPGLTAEHFLPSPFGPEPGARLYRTGDLARYLPGGDLEFCGRADERVQVNGFSFNLSEIEAALLEHERVQQALVLRTGTKGQSTAAYVVGPTEAEIRSFLQQRLPAYMLPESVFALGALPLTADHRVDRASLLDAADAARSQQAPVAAGSLKGKEDRVAARRAELAARRARLSTEQQALLNERLQKAAGKQPARESLPKRDPQTPAPLSFAQRRLWFLDQLEPDNPLYNMPIALRLRGRVDVAALEKCLGEILRRHEALRTVFRADDAEPVQVVCPAAPFTLPIIDLTGLDEAAREAEARRLAGEEARRPFDLGRGPLLRAQLIRLGELDHLALLTMHHIVSDGWSMGVLTREVVALYGAFSRGLPSPLPELPIQYADFAAWQREWLQGERLESLLRYWRGQLEDAPPFIELPTDAPRPALVSLRGAVFAFGLPPRLSEALRALARGEDMTLFMLLLAGFYALLHRYTGQHDIVVGTPVAGRHRAETEDLIGFFINTLVMRARVGGELTSRQLLERVRETCLGAYAHQEMPFEVLVERLQPERSLSYTPLFQVMLVLQNAVAGTQAATDAGAPAADAAGMTVSPLEGGSGTAKFDLTLVFSDTAEGLRGVIEYRTSLFEQATVERMARHLEQVLSVIAGDGARPLRDWPLLSAEEEEQLLRSWNPPPLRGPGLPRSVGERFSELARSSPDALAVVSPSGRRLTYAQLEAQANRLAHHLLSRGLGREEVVGVLLPRAPEMIVSLLGVLKAGGVYLPLEPQAPARRQAQLLGQSGARRLITAGGPAAEAIFETGLWRGEALSWSELEPLPGGEPAPALADAVVEPHQLAYVIYTSGSTGEPKGVMVSHANVLSRICRADYAELGPGTRLLQMAPLAFDASTFEVWGALLTGGAVVQAAEGVPQASTLREHVERDGVTTLFLTTALLNAVADEDVSALGGLRELLTGGEAASAAHMRRVSEELPGGRFRHVYGPTEATTFACCHRVEGVSDAAASVPIGRAIADAQVYVVDEQLRPAPVGVNGELLIGGPGVARGYLGRPAMTAERFIPDSFSGEPGARLYRTGDVVRWTNRGALEFVGRRDNQVKLRGYRIELPEVEAALSAHPGVGQAAVIAEREGGRVKRLVGYVVVSGASDGAAGGHEALGQELRRALRERLPEYMVPAAVVVLEELPLTPNGKVDRKALPAPEHAGAAGEGLDAVAPRDEVELELARVWEEVLQSGPVGVKDNFFDRGGHSLLAVHLFSAIEKRFGRRLPLSTLFRHPTVEQLAVALRERDGRPRRSPLVTLQGAGAATPFFCVHPGGGGVFRYLELARHLGTDRPFHAFQAAGLDDDEEPAAGVEEMAARYVEAMRGVRPSGPYMIGGWSFGGLVAFEMSRQLEALGEEVSLLALLDTVPPRRRAARLNEDDPALLFAFVRDLGLPPEALSLSADELKGLELGERLAAVLAEAKGAGVVPPDVTPADVRRLWRVFMTNLRAQQDYRARPSAARITLFQAAEAPPRRKRRPRWEDFTAAGVEVYNVPGSHYTIVGEPHVRTLAALLDACLRRAEAGVGALD